MPRYDVDYSLQSERLCPPKRRTPILLAWLKVLMLPLQQMHDAFFTVFMPEIVEEIKYNGRTIVLEAILNKVYGTQFRIDPDVSDIFIVNNVGAGNIVYLSENGDSNTITYFGDHTYDTNTIYLGDPVDYMPVFDFTVYVPSTIISAQGLSVINAEIAKFAIAGVNWQILGY